MPAYRRARKKPISEINVVPYIDVMLVLLVIFMVTAPLLQHGVEVNLPDADSVAAGTLDSEPLVININEAGEIFSTAGENPKQPINMTRLQAQVAAFMRVNPGLPIYVGGDEGADYGAVLAVFVTLQRLGRERVLLMTESGGSR